ncbi:LutC/YkgG family protein [Sulfurisoma sediminicola]|uniref:L-lactate dehydrogenase complex protein LldG n=1 Tax=Sulfurisoma sediminicola TaxID=1381557 RepID=A0A497XB46_9PROT|nr:lactate utilization protein C [Sulfurisoma sediminicola]RLJ63797.1 L-lactate dehydrogenase complex protein LldG [Sulfurisoma sediminicola]
MNDSRDLILGRIRERLGRSPANVAPAQTAMDVALAAKSAGPRPRTDADLVAAFRARSEALASTVDQVACLADVPRAVAAYLAEHKLPARAVCVPDLAGLDWRGAGVEVEARGAIDHDLVGITGCFRAIAETGTLMLCTGRATPATVSLLPETHIAVVPATAIVDGMEEAWSAARSEFGQMPRAVNFISGPSRTGDIEQTIVLGAHGPYRVHVVIAHGQ